MKSYEYHISTPKQGMIDITAQVREALVKSGVRDGICVIFCTHTTGAITVNENADPDVIHDFLIGLDAAFPDRREFRHGEGNSAAHLKSSAVGCSQTLIVQDGRPVLGTWQGVYFCEFDGPRSRRFLVKFMPDSEN